MESLIKYWYLQSPLRFYTAMAHGISTLDATFAVRDTLRNINKPLFQDYTWQGRFIGVLMRLARVGVALFLYFFALVGYIVAFIFWIIFPIICIFSIVGSAVAS